MKLAGRLAADETVLTAWSGLPGLDGIHLLARTRYDAVTLDMQHGAHTEASVHAGIVAVAAAGKPAIVRIPLARFDAASRAADFGAEAIIAPMINSIDDARAFVMAAKYPPVGQRSWGPWNAVAMHGGGSAARYLEVANSGVVTFAMIETRDALGILDDILDVRGIDGVFVGPADFSISWTDGATMDPALPDMQEAIATIATKARGAGKHAAIFAFRPEMVPTYQAMGYRLIALGTDQMIVGAGADALIGAALGSTAS